MEEESSKVPCGSVCHPRCYLGGTVNLFLIKWTVLVLTPDLGFFLASVSTFQEHSPPGARGIPREICLDGGNIQD